MQEAAEAQLASQHNRAVHLVAGEGWHPGVIGIVAGRIKEKTGKPSLVIALDGDTGKGSAGRSGADLGAAIIARATRVYWLRRSHAMAAGLTVPADRIDALAEWLDSTLERR